VTAFEPRLYTTNRPRGLFTIRCDSGLRGDNVHSSGFRLQGPHWDPQDGNGHGVTDVIGVEEGHWSVSWGGRSTWQPLNVNLSDSLNSVLIGDLDGKGSDDIARYVVDGPLSGHWEVSRGGRTGWQRLATMQWPSSAALEQFAPASTVRGFVGRFQPGKAAQLIAVDYNRFSKAFNPATGAFEQYSKYAY
jgi:hypothetical protein